MQDPQPREAALSPGQDNKILEAVGPEKVLAGVVLEALHLEPVGPVWLIHGRGAQRELLLVPRVGEEDQVAELVQVIDLVNDPLLPWGHHLEEVLDFNVLARLNPVVNCLQVYHVNLSSLLAPQPRKEDFAAPRLPQSEPEALVVFFEQELVPSLPGPLFSHSDPKLVGPVGLVHLAVKDQGVVEAPRNVPGGLLDGLLRVLLPVQIPETDLVRLVPSGINGVGHQVFRWGGDDAPHVAVRQILRDVILVEDHIDVLALQIFLGVALKLCPAVQLVAFPLESSGEVTPAEGPLLPRDLVVRLLQVRFHLLVDLAGEGLQVARGLLAVVILLLQVIDNLLALPLIVPEPKVRIRSRDRWIEQGPFHTPPVLPFHDSELHLMRHPRGQRLRFPPFV
mmetsp:Transcript_2827/g.7750  ORF Transcript_2827/g.7750 Transcript_2827/m.7750 type:complete len:394 (+) Transcript_2827:369-1550(+)